MKDSKLKEKFNHHLLHFSLD